jgi:beta-glucosidase
LTIPILVSENGIATDDDERRIEFIRRAASGVRSCIAEGVDVIGYLYWTAFDNFEWTFGYSMRFGMIGVDRTTMRRTVKESGRYLGRVASSNGMAL